MFPLSIEGLVTAVVVLIVLGLVFWLLNWAITACGVPDPFARIARVVLVLAAVLVIISVLLSFIGHPLFVFR